MTVSSKCDKCEGDAVIIKDEKEDLGYWMIIDRNTGYLTETQVTKDNEIEEGFRIFPDLEHPLNDPNNMYVCDDCFQEILDDIDEDSGEEWKGDNKNEN